MININMCQILQLLKENFSWLANLLNVKLKFNTAELTYLTKVAKTLHFVEYYCFLYILIEMKKNSP